MEKNFVISREDLDIVENHILKHYGDVAIISKEKGVYDVNISFAKESYINLIENDNYHIEFPQAFITKVAKIFSTPLYFYLSTNNVEKGEEFLEDLPVKKIFFVESSGGNFPYVAFENIR